MTTKIEHEFIPGLAGVPVIKSKISDIDGHRGILKLRGYTIQDLAEHSTFEETAYLVLKGELPTRKQLEAFKNELAAHRIVEPTILDLIKLFPKTAHPMSALQTGVAAMGLFHPRNTDDDEMNHQATVRLIAQVPTILAAFQNVRQGKDPIPPLDDLSHSANFLYMINGELPDPLVEKIFDVCLILHIEHTVNASTFTSMVACSTLADPYSTVAAAIASLSGPLHGGANERVLRMLQEIGSVENARAAMEEKIARKQVIFGLGHREYKTMDPRATILKGLCTPLFEKFGCTPLYDIAVEVEKVAIDMLGPRGIWPNVDFYSGIVYDMMGIPVDLFTPVFAVSRVAGWVAHWAEQLSDNKIFRPTQIYEGADTRPYVPLGARS
jgi:citrate synthase